MSDNIKNYTIESYAVFINVDESILLTNTFLEKFGYKFLKLTIKELEQNFSELLSLPSELEFEQNITLEKHGIKISNQFYNALENSKILPYYSIIMNNEVFFLKSLNEFNQEVINNNITLEEPMKHVGEFKKFVTNLIQQFRLFKNGGINSTTDFFIRKKERTLFTYQFSHNNNNISNSLFSLNQNEADLLGSIFKNKFITNNLTELAIINFNLSYSIGDIKTKYIVLITCLECLFNVSEHQITHTISRHVALIISNTKKDFEINYKRVKELYGMRSTIVHGGSRKGDLYKLKEELHDIVRQVINYCLTLNIDKIKLFENLNASGLEEFNNTVLNPSNPMCLNNKIKQIIKL